jgi:uncharacterized protein (TIGR02996 family)
VPLFELEEGPHHKFYRIERDGTRLHIHWGRIGSVGHKKTLVLETEAEAKRELDAEMERRLQRGYRRVHDEAAPHDHEEARQRALAATGALTKYPRFVFRKRDRVTWLEVRGAMLVTAAGRAGTMPTPVERPCGSEHAALRERDRMMAELVGEGYVLDEFGAAEPPAAKRRAPRVGELRVHPELEAQLAAAPDDVNAWLVYEDWLLDQRDPRSKIIEHERAGDVTAAALARGAIKKLLLGSRAATFENAISHATWRAGFVRACQFDATGTRGSHRLVEFLATAAARYLTELDVDLADFDQLADLAGGHALRVLGATPEYQGLHVVDASLLEPLEQLRELSLHNLTHLEPAPCLARLTALMVAFPSATELGELAAAPLHNVAALVLHVGNGVLRYTRGELVAALPALRSLSIVIADDQVDAALDVVLGSGLAPQLKRLDVAAYSTGQVLSPAERARVLGGKLAHLERLNLPSRLVK